MSDWQALVLPFAFAGVTTASLLAPRFVQARRLRGEVGQPPSSQTAGPHLVALILALALAESVCILGLVLGFLGAPPTVVLPFFVVTWILMLVRFSILLLGGDRLPADPASHAAERHGFGFGLAH